jgi:hypothetical protein
MKVSKSLIASDYLNLCDFYILVVSYNLPRFCPNASWNTTSVKFADTKATIERPISIFITLNNTVYVVALESAKVQMWFEGNNTSTKTVANFSGKLGVFVALNGDIYVNHASKNEVSVWHWISQSSAPVMQNDGPCYSLFLDTNNTIYCSLYSLNKVVKKSLNNSSNPSVVAAHNLQNSLGIFVHINFTLYVADNGNNRIQYFQPGKADGTSVAGTGSSSLVTLDHPTAVVLDADGYLFIVDGGGHIYGSGPDGFRCLVGCSNSGSSQGTLSGLRRLSFDSHGNIFATDAENYQIRKFILATNSCSKYLNTWLKSNIENKKIIRARASLVIHHLFSA